MRASVWVPYAVLVLAAGCDPRAADSSAATRNRLSTAYETCQATTDCAGELRCRGGQCRDTKTAVVGEYYAAAGRLALQEKRYEDAIAAYTEATKIFDVAKVTVPPEINCGSGEALIRAGGDPQRYELAARVLHRCLMASPVGTPQRDRALTLLAGLGGQGLDPDLLAKDKLSDRYMTKAPAMPATDELVLTVTQSPDVRSSSYTKWQEQAQTDDVKNALLPCWQEYWKTSREDSMSVTLPFKHSFKLDQYGDFGATTLVIEDLEPSGDSAKDTAAQCAKDALQPIADEHVKGKHDERRWTTNMTFVLAPR